MSWFASNLMLSKADDSLAIGQFLLSKGCIVNVISKTEPFSDKSSSVFRLSVCGVASLPHSLSLSLSHSAFAKEPYPLSRFSTTPSQYLSLWNSFPSNTTLGCPRRSTTDHAGQSSASWRDRLAARGRRAIFFSSAKHVGLSCFKRHRFGHRRRSPGHRQQGLSHQGPRKAAKLPRGTRQRRTHACPRCPWTATPAPQWSSSARHSPSRRSTEGLRAGQGAAWPWPAPSPSPGAGGETRLCCFRSRGWWPSCTVARRKGQATSEGCEHNRCHTSSGRSSSSAATAHG